jgi:hypothetical protein
VSGRCLVDVNVVVGLLWGVRSRAKHLIRMGCRRRWLAASNGGRRRDRLTLDE